MKATFRHIIPLLLLLSFSLKGFAQPPTNDTCLTAEPLTVGVGSCSSILYTNVGATTTGNPSTPPCWLPNSMSHTVWFSFVATKADIEVSTNFGGTLADTQIAVYSGTCGALTLLACQEDVNTAGGLLHTDVLLHGLTIGNTYHIAVDGNGNTTGTFGVCAQEAAPIGPPLPTQDCTGSQTLCNLNNIVVADGSGGVGLSQESPSCFGAPGERSSNWYSFTVATSGTLCFTISPNTDIDYDFAIYNTTSSCPGTEIVCNWDPDSPVTGLGCTGFQCESCIPVTAGQTYTILVDRYTAAATSGFVMNFGGTTATFASPNPTFTATTACIGTATQFTNTTSGNFTYSWNFGDGFTSNVENPTHTYAAAGTYTASLLLTAVPGGCQNSISQPVTVNPLPTVNAGSGSTVCPGTCVTLSGSTNAIGSTGPITFTNPASYAIPDGSTVGVYSPIVVSGLNSTTINATSIASVCLNMTHTWDSDLDIFLQCPDGTRIQLSTDNGGANPNYTNTCFTANATTAITAGTAPFSGSYLPEDPFTLLNGCSANGTWQLFVQDDLGGDTGSISGWAITFNNAIPAISWSPTTGMTNPSTLNPTVCPSITTTYTLTANNGTGCTSTDQVTITVSGGPTATINYSAAAYCTSATTQAVTLTGTGTYTGGVYSAPIGLTINPISGLITPSTSTPGPYTVTYTIPASGSCPASTTTTTVTINTPPNAGTDGSVAVCDSSVTPIDLFSLITGEQAGGVWSRSSGASGTFNAAGGTFTPSAGATSSTFTYTVAGVVPCGSDTSLATITINAQPNAGTDGSVAVCDSSVTPIDLFSLITGEQVGGVWTRSSGAGGTFNAAAGTFTPAAGATSSIFTYTVAGVAPCGNDTSLATITINPQPNAGTDGSVAVCDSSVTPIDLFSLITGEQAGGVWTRSSGAGGTFNAAGGTFTPAAGATSSTFTYTVAGVAPCGNDTSLATITINAQPNAGTDGSVTICDSSVTPIDLFSIITGEQAGGVWTRSSGGGGTFNAAAGTFTPAAGANSSTFTYTVAGVVPCGSDTSLATITINAQPNAGTDGSVTICDSSVTPIDLFSLITGEQAGGVWTRSSGAGGTFNGTAGTFTPAAGATSSTFTYTVAGVAPCGNDTSLATITINAQPNAGTDGSVAVCDSSVTPIDLFSLITGEQAGGVWTRSSGASGTFNAAAGTFTPAAGATSSTFTYTVAGVAPCGNDTSLATITINPQPNAGTDGSVAVCDSSVTPIDLFSLITGEQVGGVWTRSSGAGGTFNAAAGTFTPAAGATSSTFTYTVAGVAPCGNDTALATIAINPELTPTINCGASTTTSVQFNWSAIAGATGYTLNYQINANPVVTIGAIGNVLTYNVNSLTPGDNVTITLTPSGAIGTCFASGSATCAAINCTPPTASINYSGAPFCNSNSIQQNVTLTGTGTYTGGVFSASSNLSINSASGAITPNTSIPGTYTVTYTIAPTAGCSPVIATTSLTINTQPNAGTLSGNQAICVGLTTTFSSSSTGGTWSSSNVSIATINSALGVITGVSAGTATMTYTVLGTGGCANVTATRTVTVTATPIAGTLSGNQAICEGFTTTFSSTSAGGTWSSSNVSIATINSALGVITGVSAGTATLTYTVLGTGGCANVTATRTVTVTAPPIAGTLSGNQAICVGLTTTFSSTSAGGTWTSSNTAVATINSVSGVITGVSAGVATMTYTVLGTGGCANVTATRTVTVTAAPIAGNLSGNQAICVGFTTTFASTSAGGTWSSSNVAVATINSASGVITGVSAGVATMTYTVLGTGGCTNVTATRTVTVNAPPIAGTLSGNQAICEGFTTTFASTSAGGTWSSSNVAVATINSVSGVITGVSAGVATMTYTVLGTGGCANVTATRTITVTAAPIAGTLSGNQAICVGLTTTFSSTSAGGTWTSSNTAVATINSTSGLITGVSAGTATMTYTVLGTGGCTNVTATRTVAVTAAPVAGNLSGNQTICVGLTTTFASTSAGGTWSSSNVAVATINSASGLITGVSAGTATMTYTVLGTGGCTNVTATRTVTVTAPPIAGTLSGNQTICVGFTTTFSSTSAGGTWTSSNTAVATINSASGLITGVSAGTATMTYTVLGTGGCTNVTATRTVTVTAAPVAGNLSGNQTICVGLTTTFSSTSAGGTWTSSNVAVATINSVSGVITGVSAGTAIMTYTVLGTGGCANVTATRTVTVNPTPQIVGLSSVAICSGESPNIVINGTVFGTTFAWTVIQNGVLGASNGSGNSIDQILTATSGTTGTAVYTITPTLNSCTGSAVTIVVRVNPKPAPTLDSGIVCVDLVTGNTAQPHTFVSGLNNTNYTFQWFFNGALITGVSSNTYTANAAGVYSVVATNTLTGCVSEEVFGTVTASIFTNTFSADVTEAFTENQNIVVNTPVGTGPFQYQLDNGPIQETNVFYNVSGGLHTVSVRDALGCTDLKGDVLIVDYPRFFTPNGDTYNDTWNVIGLESQPNSRIYIFDRYGKFLKQISPIGKGWDGTYNGRELPSTDYWFTVDYIDPNRNNGNRTFKSHFSLKR